jgi:hypothetical protein
LDTVIRDEYGRRLVEFVVDNLSVEERYTGRLAAGLLLLQLKRSSADLADRLHKRIADAEPIYADTLGK